MADSTVPTSEDLAFPALTDEDLAALRPLASCCVYKDGETIFSAGAGRP